MLFMACNYHKPPFPDINNIPSSYNSNKRGETSNWYHSMITTKEIISIFPLWTFHLFVAKFQQHLHMVYIIYFWVDIIPKLVIAATNVATEPRVPIG